MEKNNSKILALKYRPRIFKDLIGQEIIAQTISNAIKINKTPNAYLLTGIRGVGKTTKCISRGFRLRTGVVVASLVAKNAQR